MSGRYGSMALDGSERFQSHLRRISEKLQHLVRRDQFASRHGVTQSARGDIQTVQQIVSLSDIPDLGMKNVHRAAKRLLHAYSKDDVEYRNMMLADLTQAVSRVHEDNVTRAAQVMKRAHWR